MTSNPNFPPELVAYKSWNLCISDGVYGFLSGVVVGSAWGLVSPFHPPGAIAGSSILPPFSSIRSVSSNAAVFGSVFAVLNLSAKSLELARRKEDDFNTLFGLAVMAKYIQILFSSERRLILHNRSVGIVAASTIVYANLFA